MFQNSDETGLPTLIDRRSLPPHGGPPDSTVSPFGRESLFLRCEGGGLQCPRGTAFHHLSAGCHLILLFGYVFESNILVADSVAHNAIVERDVGLSAVLLADFEAAPGFVDHGQTIGVAVGSDEHVIVESCVHGLRKRGIQLNSGRPARESTGAEVFEPVLRRFDRIQLDPALVANLHNRRLGAAACDVTLGVDIALALVTQGF